MDGHFGGVGLVARAAEVRWPFGRNGLVERLHGGTSGVSRYGFSVWNTIRCEPASHGRSSERPDGSGHVYYDAKLNATVEAYAALGSIGYDKDMPRLQRACRWILDDGGLCKVSVFTPYWLLLLGEWPWENTPTIRHLQFRAIGAHNARSPQRHLSAQANWGSGAAGLFPAGRKSFEYDLPTKVSSDEWDWTCRSMGRILRTLQNIGEKLSWHRRGAIRAAIDWIVEHQDDDGGWGGIQPPWLYRLIALRLEGFGHDHPRQGQGSGLPRRSGMAPRSRRRNVNPGDQ